MWPKASSSERKCRCLELDCALHRPLIHLQLSHNGSPTMGTASPPQISQQREEIPLPKTHPSPMGAADSSQIQLQRKEMPLPGSGMSAPPIAETPFPATALPSELPPFAPLSTASPCTATPHTASLARLLQTADIPPETDRLFLCHNPWPTEDVLSCPDDALPAFVTGIPALSSGPELWIAVHNHRSEPLQLHSGQNIGVLEVVTLADTPPTTSHASSHPKSTTSPTTTRASLTAPAAAVKQAISRV